MCGHRPEGPVAQVELNIPQGPRGIESMGPPMLRKKQADLITTGTL